MCAWRIFPCEHTLDKTWLNHIPPSPVLSLSPNSLFIIKFLFVFLFFRIFQQVGEALEKGCEERCICHDAGKWECEARCQGVFVQRGKMQNLDPHCYERSTSDECCSTVRCDNDAEIVDLGELVNQEIAGNWNESLCGRRMVQRPRWSEPATVCKTNNSTQTHKIQSRVWKLNKHKPSLCGYAINFSPDTRALSLSLPLTHSFARSPPSSGETWKAKSIVKSFL